MNTYKGFVNVLYGINANFPVNTSGGVPTIGEISTYSRTFSITLMEYLSAAHSGYEYISMLANDLNGVNIVVPQTQIDEILAIVSNALVYSNTNTVPYATPSAFVTAMMTGTTGVTNIQYGSIIISGKQALPEWISWSSANGDFNKVWTCDTSLRAQYDSYTITVVPPFAPIDGFFTSPANVQLLLSAVSAQQLMIDIQIAKNSKPDTTTQFLSFNYIPPSGSGSTTPIPTLWGIIINGAIGNNIDAIKAAIAAYITANSASPQSSWLTIIPDIFTKIEFMIVPRWFKYAIPPSAVNTGLYSAIANLLETKTYLDSFITAYPAGWVDNNTEIIPMTYKNVSLAAVAGNLNGVGYKTLIGLVPDYMPIPSTSPDYNRMSAATQAWVANMITMLMVAEVATVNAGIPLNMAKVTRNGKLYVSMSFNNVDYLVYAKSNLV